MGFISTVFKLTIIVFLIVAVYIFYTANPEIFHKGLSDLNNFTNNPSKPSEQTKLQNSLYNYFSGKGVDFKSLDVNGFELIVTVSAPLIPDNLLDSAANDIYTINDSLKQYASLNRKILRISLNYFYGTEPLFQMSTLREYLVDKNMFLEHLDLKDLRTTSFKIESDCWVFDYTIESVDVNSNAIVLTVSPETTDTHTAINDLVNMAFVALQDYPVADMVVVKVDLDNEFTTFNFNSDDLLAYMNDEIDFETLMSHATTVQ